MKNCLFSTYLVIKASQWLSGKESACSAGDMGSVPGWEDPLGEGMTTHSIILAWKNPMDRGAWQATVHSVSKSLK